MFASSSCIAARAASNCSPVTTPIATKLKDLADTPERETLMITVDYPPGAAERIHRHDAHAFVYVMEGMAGTR